ncbi:MAG TPA: DUF2950 family protein [Steroidobacteraceae bacterium]|nr:DUF2950 family protein [Steroidobacteraceae bacterium]
MPTASARDAQRILSSAGKQDGLAWQNPDGTCGGPIGEKIAHAIEQGYNLKADPYHGYFFKVLKGRDPPPRSGLKTFMVSHTGVVYEKDLGPDTLAEFQQMERFNPDKSWTPVVD